MKVVNIDDAIDVINRQVKAIAIAQDSEDASDPKLNSAVWTMSRGLAAWLAEQRKSEEDAEEKLKGMTPERIATLTLRLVAKLSPEYRAAVALRIEELDGKLIAHE